MKRQFTAYILLFSLLVTSCTEKTIDLSDYGIHPNTGENSSPLFAEALKRLEADVSKNEKTYIKLSPGRYDFYPEKATEKELYISNHDQDNPKSIGILFENMQNVIFDAQGSELIFHGRMLPVTFINSKNSTLKNFSIDFENPHISQVKILENDTINHSIIYQVAPWVEYEIRDSTFIAKGLGWEHTPRHGIAFEENTKRLVYQTSDIYVGSKHVVELEPRIIKAYHWDNKKLIPGTVVVMRSYHRPTPSIFVSHNENTILENIKIHYAEGMGLLAQMSENITLDHFSVCLRGEDDPRYFTTQADATHFSGCKGTIISKNGTYEGMMDDAINVHGTYLKIMKRIDDHTLEAHYMHGQSYGFEWGRTGDTTQFIKAATMEITGEKNVIQSIKAVDKPDYHGAKIFHIAFAEPLDTLVNENGSFGIENLEWTPEVIFTDNVIRNNRARGSLFSTPKKTRVENNLFDHTSGTAILLCGDCNGWYETGACCDVIIRNNTFINSLTNMFQFTNAIISIYPEIPDLNHQHRYFHSNILIENNTFETFDTPIVYAKSVDGIIFRNNTIHHNTDYPAFHWNKYPFLFERVINWTIENNEFDKGFDVQKYDKIEN
ncbi:MAG: right-handed parallel beta-helix repeat-containing protein [Bacteroidales bacterium]|nr:right-handed parallel beta-helix repeat-containing protein [Bacteroidales bacterium]